MLVQAWEVDLLTPEGKSHFRSTPRSSSAFQERRGNGQAFPSEANGTACAPVIASRLCTALGDSQATAVERRCPPRGGGGGGSKPTQDRHQKSLEGNHPDTSLARSHSPPSPCQSCLHMGPIWLSPGKWAWQGMPFHRCVVLAAVEAVQGTGICGETPLGLQRSQALEAGQLLVSRETVLSPVGGKGMPGQGAEDSRLVRRWG